MQVWIRRDVFVLRAEHLLRPLAHLLVDYRTLLGDLRPRAVGAYRDTLTQMTPLRRSLWPEADPLIRNLSGRRVFCL